MNLILLEESQLLNPSSACLNTRQSDHVNKILNVKVGDALDVGLINGPMGRGTITQKTPSKVVLDKLIFDTAPPATLPVTLILALPRPQMIKRILQTVACMGVETLCLLHSSKVEKSFWQSPSVRNEAIKDQLILGLEQGKATQLPVVKKYQSFKAFSKEYFDNPAQLLAKEQAKELKIIAHPGNFSVCPALSKTKKTTLVIGPESGFTQPEVDMFCANHFMPHHLGERILKVETAVTALLSRFI